MEWSREQEIQQLEMERPHLVILGAGASRAAFPDGEKNSKQLPLMNDLVNVVGVRKLLSDAGVDTNGQNFEEIYAKLFEDETHHGIGQQLEDAVYEYFSSLELPDQPSLYDYVVLSLREKDVIATFNWDPFLIQACRRNGRRFGCPKLLFLHGNVLAGYCERDKVAGLKGSRCRNCSEPFQPSRLLYPIRKKDYHLQAFIEIQWQEVQQVLKSAFMVTIFGYSAPQSDVDALELFKKAWGAPSNRAMEQFEIIDIKPEEELRKTWGPFIHSHHYETHANFWGSWMANHPRRTGEAYLNQYQQVLFIENNPMPRDVPFERLRFWTQRLRDVELQGVT